MKLQMPDHRGHHTENMRGTLVRQVNIIDATEFTYYPPEEKETETQFSFFHIMAPFLSSHPQI